MYSTLFASMPAELINLPQWIPTVMVDDLDLLPQTKRPAARVNDTSRHLPLHELASNDYRNYGIVTHADSPLCIIDVDKFSETPEPARSRLLQLTRLTYSETSLSGNGIHIMFNILTPKMPTCAYIKSSSYPIWYGQLSLCNNFMVCTGNRLPDSPPTVAELSLDDIRPLFPASKTLAKWCAPESTAPHGIESPATPPSSAFSDHHGTESLADFLREFVTNGTGVAGGVAGDEKPAT